MHILTPRLDSRSPSPLSLRQPHSANDAHSDDDESSPVDWNRLASAHKRGKLPQHLRANLLGESLPDHMVQFLLLPLSAQPGPREAAAKVLAIKYYDPETGKLDLRKTRFFHRGAELLLEQVEAEEARAKAILDAEGALESQSLPSTSTSSRRHRAESQL
ncbi:hypothetical protein LTR53_014375 [Teratosphaeriaceae sp. CCFEE 6253]|nr:hypothetical protein LTR53_014375 [Teratosphaeriaceae sp. CCFEE 6253]